MNRRHFLSTLAASTVAMVLDPELALWKPGAKTIFLPPKKAFAYTLADPPSGLSIRMVQEYDIQSDVYPVRLDVLYGAQVLQPSLMRVIRSDHPVDAMRYAQWEQAVIGTLARDLSKDIDRRALDYAESMLGVKLDA